MTTTAATSNSHLSNAIRALAMDAVQQANSGHPGAPMGMAEIAEALWTRHLRHNPADPAWAERDRLALSHGHGSQQPALASPRAALWPRALEHGHGVES